MAQGSYLQFKCRKTHLRACSNSVEPAFAPCRRPPLFCQNSEDPVRVLFSVCWRARNISIFLPYTPARAKKSQFRATISSAIFARWKKHFVALLHLSTALRLSVPVQGRAHYSYRIRVLAVPSPSKNWGVPVWKFSPPPKISVMSPKCMKKPVWNLIFLKVVQQVHEYGKIMFRPVLAISTRVVGNTSWFSKEQFFCPRYGNLNLAAFLIVPW